MIENAIEIRKPLTPATWRMISEIAPAMHQSRLFGVNSAEQAMAIMLKGHELGLNLAASFEFIDVIQGKPALKPKGALALIHDHPECAGVKVEDITGKDGKPLACRVWMKRRNGFEYTIEFSMADAQRAGLVKKDSGWDKYPSNMLRWRAIGYCADIVFPDVTGGMMRADDYGVPISEDGDVIEGSWSTKAEELTEDEMIERELMILTDYYGAEAVLAAGNGVLPTTWDQLKALAAALEGIEEEE